EKLLARIPEGSGITFTDEQLEVVDLAFSNWNGVHPIDIRCSIPIWRRFYISLVAGPERRSKERRQQDREAHPLMIFGNIVLIAFSLIAVGLALMLYGDGFTNTLKESWFLFLQQVSAVRDFLFGV
ncbi:MAG: hypothetical protein V3T02_05525, partial [Alphaproteobacteria bacterium]